MAIRHCFRDFTPGNVNPKRADWNVAHVFDQEDGISKVDQAVEQIIQDLPEQAESFGRTASTIEPGEPPKAFYHMEKSLEEMKNLGRPDEVDKPSDEFRERVWDQVDAIQESGNRVQSNSVKYVDHLMAVSPQYFRPDDPNAAGKFDRDKVEVWLRDSLRTIKEEFDDKNLAGVEVHFDESTPHIHFQTVPETTDGRLSVNDQFSPATLSGMQTAYAENLPEEIERGKEDSPAERKTMAEVYHDTAEELEELREEKQQLQERVDDLEADQIHDRADQVRRLPDHLLDDLLEDPDYGENAIDQVMNEKDLNFAEATVFIYQTQTIQQFLAQESVTNQIGPRKSSPEDPIESEFKEKLDEDGTYQELKDELVKTKRENETLKDKLDEVAEEHGLEIEAGDFYADYSDQIEPEREPSDDIEPQA
jgi:hypothetical protein